MLNYEWVCRVPEECPLEIANLIQQCKLVDPKQRPSAREVFEVLKRNCLVKRYVHLPREERER